MNSVYTWQRNYYPITLLTSHTNTVFFKKLYVILKKSLQILKEFNDKMGTKVEIFFNFWPDFKGNTYFYNTSQYIRLNYTKLTHSDYIIKVLTKFGSTATLYINTSQV